MVVASHVNEKYLYWIRTDDLEDEYIFETVSPNVGCVSTAIGCDRNIVHKSKNTKDETCCVKLWLFTADWKMGTYLVLNKLDSFGRVNSSISENRFPEELTDKLKN